MSQGSLSLIDSPFLDVDALVKDIGSIGSFSIGSVEIHSVPAEVSSITTTEIKSVPPFVEKTDTPGHLKIKAALFTLFGFPPHPKWLRMESYGLHPPRITLWVAQFEECPITSNIHIQGYVEFQHENRIRFKDLRKVFEKAGATSINLSLPRHPSLKQRQCAINYCLKDETRLDEIEPVKYWEKGELKFDEKLAKEWVKSATSKKRKDEKEEQVKWIESKPRWWTWDQIVHESIESKLLLASCGWGAKYHSGRAAETKRRIIKEVIVLYGAGGTGKTTMAKAWAPIDGESPEERYYRRNPDDGKFWGGGRTAYRGQRIIHLEEFCGQETASNFKEITDIGKYGPSVNIKNGGAELNHDTVIITSNHHPAAWYKNLCKDEKQWYPIVRRFTMVLFFPELRPDGTPNKPDNNQAPYFIDQTEVFKSKEMESYGYAVEHATNCWPIQEPDLNIRLLVPREELERRYNVF